MNVAMAARWKQHQQKGTAKQTIKDAMSEDHAQARQAYRATHQP